MKRIKLNLILALLGVWFVSLLVFMPHFTKEEDREDNFYRVYLNGEEVGAVSSEEEAKEDLRRARRRIARAADEMLFIDARLEIKGEHVFWGQTDRPQTIIDNMVQVLSDHEELSLEHCYTVRIGEYTLNMASCEEITSLLETVLEQYDSERTYHISLQPDNSRQLFVLEVEVLSPTQQEQQEALSQDSLPSAGIEAQLARFFNAVTPQVGRDFDDYTLGLQSIHFDERIEITEAYMPANQIMSLEDAVSSVTGAVATATRYEVQQGDSLSGIAYSHGLSVDQLLTMNPNLDGENALIMAGDLLNVTVASPKLSVDYVMQEYSEEEYTASTIYKDNSSWYTTKQEVIQQAVPGRRRIIADVTYRNDTEISREIVKEETIQEAVPMIIERGTATPPSFIWPVSGGYITSSYGYRTRPKAGASTNHPGVDIGVSIGTSVHASSGGTVISAGWMGGYGNLVIIQHSNGVQTRYGHLSRILVSVGQSVSQGDVIARSGNTGNSTGPHLHFEVRVNGSTVDPVAYVNSH